MVLSWFERNPLGDTLFKDVTGFNVPRIALTRTWKERWDVAITEMSNTSVTLSFSILVAPLLQTLAKRLAGVPSLRQLTPKAKLSMLGAAFGFYFPFAAAFWCTPFIRNISTVKRTGSANYQALIGLEQANQTTEKRTPAEEIAYQKRQIFKIITTGIGLGVLSLLAFCGLARRNVKTLPSFLQFLSKKFSLQGDFSEYISFGLKKMGKPKKLDALPYQLPGGWATALFWIAPFYLGAIHAARSDYERKEWMLKLGNSFTWFIALPKLIENKFIPKYEAILGRYGRKLEEFVEAVEPGEKLELKPPKYKAIEVLEGPLRQELETLKNRQYRWNFGLVILLLATTPQLLNWYLTKRRYAHDQVLQQAQRAQAPVPTRPARPVAGPMLLPPPPAQRVSPLTTQGAPVVGLPTVPLAASPFVYAAPPAGWAYAAPPGVWQALLPPIWAPPLQQGFRFPPQPMRLPVAQPGVPV